MLWGCKHARSAYLDKKNIKNQKKLHLVGGVVSQLGGGYLPPQKGVKNITEAVVLILSIDQSFIYSFTHSHIRSTRLCLSLCQAAHPGP